MSVRNHFKFLVLCSLVSFGYGTLLHEREDLTLVTLKDGKIRGGVVHRYNGKVYFAFKGIPYAHVSARFAAPAPPLPWKGIRDATKHGPKCPQYNMLIEQYIPGNENCLFLNVYTNSVNQRHKLPVMVFIHGGSYMFGDGDSDSSGDSDGSFGPEFLLQHRVVIVTINYRLEVLGFLSLDTPEVPGNAGLKDQAAALKWVKENIRKFGGDPDNVTIFGESSGSSAVTQHLQSPMSKGLFHKAIAQSGVSIQDWAQGTNGKERAFRAAKYLGNDSRDTTEVLEFLRSVPVEKLTNLTFKTMTEDEELRDLPIHFAPVIEKKFENVEAFMTEEAIQSLAAGKLNKVPLMIGYNSDEALLMLNDAFDKLNFTNKNLKYLVPREIAQKVTEQKTQEIGESIRNYYVGNREFTKDDAKPISDMLSDRHFVYNIHRFAHFYSTLSSTHFYKFSFDTELNVVKKDIGYGHMKGAAHADELFYLFSSKFNKDFYINNPRLKDIINRVTELWAEFATSGNPTKFTEISWTPYTRSNRTFMDINDKFTVGQDTEKERVEFWDKIYCDAGLACIAKANA